MKRYDAPETSAATMNVMAKTIWVLRRIRKPSALSLRQNLPRKDLPDQSAVLFAYRLRLFFFGAARAIHCRAAIFLQFVVKRFQADAQNLGGLGLIIVGGFERLQDQQAFRLSHRGSHSDADGICIVNRNTHRGMAKTWRQMFSFDDRAFTDDDRALQRIPQLAHVAGPRVIAKCIQHGLAYGRDPAAMFRAHLFE